MQKKILIIRFSSIGDIVLTTPVIRCLKEQLSPEIHYLTKASYLPILEHNPFLDKIYTIRKKVSEVLPKLRKERYDLIIDLHKNLRSWHIRLALFSTPTYSFDKINFAKWLMVNFKINQLPQKHIVDRYMEALSPLEVKNDGQGLSYFLPPNEEEPDKNKAFIAFAIGAAHSTKRLPSPKIISICKKIQLPIFLLGGPDVAAEGALIAAEVGPSVQNYCGKCDLHQTARFIRDASKVITHDTGMMHIAAAFQKEIISIWGNTIPEFGMYPYYPKNKQGNKVLEVSNLPCRPCSKIGYAKCPKGHFKCMQEINEDIFLKM